MRARSAAPIPLYVSGLVTNPRLVKAAEPLMEKARLRHEVCGEKVQPFSRIRCRADS